MSGWTSPTERDGLRWFIEKGWQDDEILDRLATLPYLLDGVILDATTRAHGALPFREFAAGQPFQESLTSDCSMRHKPGGIRRFQHLSDGSERQGPRVIRIHAVP